MEGEEEGKNGSNSKKGKEKNNNTVELANELDPHARA
jgi:hypothetical protein